MSYLKSYDCANYKSPYGWVLEYADCILCRGVRPPHTHTHTKNIILNASAGIVGNTPLLPLLPGPLEARMVPCLGLISGSNRRGQ